MSDYQQQEIEHERFRIIEGLLREIVANTAPAPPRPKLEKVPAVEIRAVVDIVRRTHCDSRACEAIDRWLAELDAAEGRE